MAYSQELSSEMRAAVRELREEQEKERLRRLQLKEKTQQPVPRLISHSHHVREPSRAPPPTKHPAEIEQQRKQQLRHLVKELQQEEPPTRYYPSNRQLTQMNVPKETRIQSSKRQTSKHELKREVAELGEAVSVIPATLESQKAEIAELRAVVDSLDTRLKKSKPIFNEFFATVSPAKILEVFSSLASLSFVRQTAQSAQKHLNSLRHAFAGERFKQVRDLLPNFANHKLLSAAAFTVFLNYAYDAMMATKIPLNVKINSLRKYAGKIVEHGMRMAQKFPRLSTTLGAFLVAILSVKFFGPQMYAFAKQKLWILMKQHPFYTAAIASAAATALAASIPGTAAGFAGAAGAAATKAWNAGILAAGAVLPRAKSAVRHIAQVARNYPGTSALIAAGTAGAALYGLKRGYHHYYSRKRSTSGGRHRRNRIIDMSNLNSL